MEGRKRSQDDSNDDSKSSDAKRPLLVESSAAMRMMAKMGYKEGGGLGREGQGITVPVALSTQRGRRGLGLKVSGFEGGPVEWDWNSEVIEAKEDVQWLAPYENNLQDTPVNEWIEEGKEKLNIDDEDKYCDPEVLEKVLDAKSVFDQLDELELRKARGRCNPFESIGKMFFQNRAALKMANIDAACDFMFTQPKTMQDQPMVRDGQLLFFADVCAGPGGFTEYILWRMGWMAKGFGFTLRGGNDFKLEDFYAASTETFEPCYGVDNDGDVFKPHNLAHFKDHVLANSDGRGVHFMMADGGFSVEGQENIQEILSHQLYLCQCLVALSIVRPGGHFVVKLFDVFTPFSASLLWLMRHAFHQICIMKPNTSRPANSERYLVCKWRLQDVSAIERLMWTANEKFQRLKGSGKTVLSLVPETVIEADKQFFDYLKESNNELGRRQAVSLAKIKAFCQDTTLHEPRQIDMKKMCLELWNVPEKTRTAPRPARPDDVFAKYTVDWRQNCPDVTPPILENNLKMLEWRCFAMNAGRISKKCTLFLSVGRGNVYFLDKGRWNKVDMESVKMDLPAETLLFGELVFELRGEARAQMSIKVLHVMDAFILGGQRVDRLSFDERLQRCKVFAKAVDRPSRTDLTRLYVKEPFHLDDLDSLFVKLTTKKIKQCSGDRKMCFMLDDNEEQFFMVGGLMFVKIVKEPWTIAYSKSASRKYWFNLSNGASTYDHPPDASTDFETCVKCRMIWWWDDKVNLAMGEDMERLDRKIVHRITLVEQMDKQKRDLRMS